jgi:Tol biopolymer transport system component
MTMTRPAIARFTVAVPLALAVLFSVPVQRGGSGTTIARAGMTSSLGADAPLHRMSNGKIAFIGFADGSLDVINPDGSGLRILARCKTRGCTIFDAVWSPDGRRIAFVRGGPSPSSPHFSKGFVSVMNANGSGERRVASCGRSFMTCFGRSLAWSPDSTRLVISRGGSLYVHDLKIGGVRRLTAPPIVALDPAWSPDASRITFGRALHGCGNGCPTVPYIVNADGHGLRRLSTFSGDECCGGPLWSPDGRTIAFNVVPQAQRPRHQGSGGIYAVNPDGSHRRRLLPAPRRGKSNVLQDLASWSPDGRHILYSRSPSASSEPQGGTLWEMNANGTGQRRLYRDRFGIGAAIWSPDGQRIVFSANSGGFVTDADGGHRHLLVAQANELAWQPIP